MDAPARVKENLARIRFQIGVGSDALLSVTQVHGNEVVEVTHLEDVSEVKADGLFTQLPNVALAIRTADCVPILMTDKSATVVAALHAGWRSAVADIVGEGLKRFRPLLEFMQTRCGLLLDLALAKNVLKSGMTSEYWQISYRTVTLFSHHSRMANICSICEVSWRSGSLFSVCHRSTM